MRVAQPPAGWQVERLGLASAVTFTNGGRRLVWSDGSWFRETRGRDGRWVVAPAPGVPSAGTMDEARRAGCEFLAEFERAG